MSNVYKRNRTESPMSVILKSKELMQLTYSLVMNDKKVPKKHRYFIGSSLYESTEKIAHYVFKANNIYVENEKDLKRRRKFQRKASQECYLLLNQLDMYKALLPNLSYNDIENIAVLADSIISLIGGWTKSDLKRFEKITQTQ